MKNYWLLMAAVIVINGCSPKKMEWVAIGDSITYLNEHLNETGNRVTKGYLTRVGEKLPNIVYTNEGYNGWTAADIANNIDQLYLEKAAVYSILLGTNDWWQGRPIGQLSDYQNNTGNHTFYGAYRIILDKLKSLNPAAKIICITPLQRTDFVFFGDGRNNAWGSYKDKAEQSLAGFAEAIKTISKVENAILLDLYNESSLSIDKLVKFKRLKDPQTGVYKNSLYPDYTAIPYNPLTDEYPYPLDAMDVTYDGLHPSDKGNEIIAGLLVEIMKKF